MPNFQTGDLCGLDHLEKGTLQPSSRFFPRYYLGDSAEITQLLNLFHRDFWNFLGQPVEEESALVAYPSDTVDLAG